jgi:hypothetical protein
MSELSPNAIDFTPAARRGLARLPQPAAIALPEHLTGPVAGNPHRLGKPLEAPFDDVWTTPARRLPRPVLHRRPAARHHCPGGCPPP